VWSARRRSLSHYSCRKVLHWSCCWTSFTQTRMSFAPSWFTGPTIHCPRPGAPRHGDGCKPNRQHCRRTGLTVVSTGPAVCGMRMAVSDHISGLIHRPQKNPPKPLLPLQRTSTHRCDRRQKSRDDISVGDCRSSSAITCRRRRDQRGS